MTWFGSIAPAGALTLSLLVAIEIFVKVLDPKKQLPPVAAIVTAVPQKTEPKLNDESAIVAVAKINILRTVFVIDTSPPR